MFLNRVKEEKHKRYFDITSAKNVFPFLLATIVLLSICSQESSAENPQSPSVVSDVQGMQFQRRHNASRLIIFVHGFTGNARETWTHDRTQAYWPELMVADEAFGEADIAVYSYSSSIFEQNFSIDEVADNLRLRMMAANIPNSYEEVVFLAHSMGGLIVRAFALKYRDLVKIPMVYFFATPTNGADLTNIASLLTSNIAFLFNSWKFSYN